MKPAARSLLEWFTPTTTEEDVFVKPDFNLGQFFFTRDTARRMAAWLDGYRNPCCLCTPRLAAEWSNRGRTVRLLDYDQRFATLTGYRHFDLLKPEPVDEDFDAVIFDPIFIDAKLLARAVRMVTSSSQQCDLIMTFPVDREPELMGAFSAYALRRTAFPVQSCNIKPEFQRLFGIYVSNGCRLAEPQ